MSEDNRNNNYGKYGKYGYVSPDDNSSDFQYPRGYIGKNSGRYQEGNHSYANSNRDFDTGSDMNLSSRSKRASSSKAVYDDDYEDQETLQKKSKKTKKKPSSGRSVRNEKNDLSRFSSTGQLLPTPLLFTIAIVTMVLSWVVGGIVHATGNEVKLTQKQIEANIERSYNRVSSIKLSDETLTILAGNDHTFTCDVSYASNLKNKNEPTQWSSSNDSVAAITDEGVMTAKSEGTAIIMCSSLSGNITTQCSVTVTAPNETVESISLDRTRMRLNSGDSLKLNTTIKYKDGIEPVELTDITFKSEDESIATVDSDGKVTGVADGTTKITASSPTSGLSAECEIVIKPVKYVAVTFDDGPGDYTDKLLDSLVQYHSKATFFCLGSCVENYPEQIKREYALGMQIGNHSYSHKDLASLSDDGMKAEIDNSKNAIKNAIGVYPTVMRPPYGSTNTDVESYVDVPLILWSIDTEDWRLKDADKICDYFLKHTEGGNIILLHDIHEFSVDGFIKALPTLVEDKSFELVTVAELYQLYGKEMQAGGKYFSPVED